MEYTPVANHYAHLAIIGVVASRPPVGAAGTGQPRPRRGRSRAGGWRSWRPDLAAEPDLPERGDALPTTLEENPGPGRPRQSRRPAGCLRAAPRSHSAFHRGPPAAAGLRPQARASAWGARWRAKAGWPRRSAQFEEALRLRPDFADAHHNLALVLEAMGQAGEHPAARGGPAVSPQFCRGPQQSRGRPRLCARRRGHSAFPGGAGPQP